MSMARKGNGRSFSRMLSRLSSSHRHFFDFFFFRAGVSPARFPYLVLRLGPVIKLRLRRPRELGDRAFLKAV